MDAAPRITALEQDPRRPGAVRLDIDGTRFGAVPRELVGAEGLVVGLPLDEGLQQRLGAAADIEAAFRTALRSLELRAFARNDLGRRLRRKGHPPDAVLAALERVAGLGLLDDASFARSYIQSRSARGRGPSRLVGDLLAMGVERSIIDRALAAELPEGTDRASVPLGLATRRAAQLGALPRQVKRRRLLAYLARRGFSGREVRDLVEGVL
ncbi:MAG TPA: regulatory protein RecX [Gemmatimonadales bacterium]